MCGAAVLAVLASANSVQRVRAGSRPRQGLDGEVLGQPVGVVTLDELPGAKLEDVALVFPEPFRRALGGERDDRG